eukprot:4833300-Lingulodinium_polyedra.AAC.1
MGAAFAAAGIAYALDEEVSGDSSFLGFALRRGGGERTLDGKRFWRIVLALRWALRPAQTLKLVK